MTISTSELHTWQREFRAARRRADISQMQAAHLIGVSVRTLSGWETGQRHPIPPANMCELFAIVCVAEGLLKPKDEFVQMYVRESVKRLGGMS